MKHRTTIAAEQDDLSTLRAEAERRGVSLAQRMRGVVAEKAAAIRAGYLPRFGLGRSGRGDLSAESVADEDAPADTPPRA